MQAYCMKCDIEREMKDTRAITMTNRKPVSQGGYPVFGARIFRIRKS